MSVVDIWNLALGHLGDTADVSSLDENSVQAQLCSRFYPIALNQLLEMATWGFATRRVKLALLATNPTALSTDTTCGTWRYAYALPNAMVNAIAVISANAPDDYEARFGVWPDALEFPQYPQGYVPLPGDVEYTPRPFVIETNPDGSQVVLTNVCDAVLRYTTLVTDATKFTPGFTNALSYLLSSMLAGPILKGDAGAAEAARQLGIFQKFESMAEASDANQRKTHVEPVVPWIRGR